MKIMEIISGILLGASFIVAIQSPTIGIFLLAMSYIAVWKCK
tara:strand:- start:12 stop:137 length:126 start_codon:yes stop_codon:yes gene_type:complete